MRAALRLADTRLAHPETPNLLSLHLPTPGAADCESDVRPTNEGALAPCWRGPRLASSPR
eukprot:12830193-Alexandrium_andersonii.AAC.1